MTYLELCVSVLCEFDFAWDNILMDEQNGAVDSTRESNVDS